MRCVCLCALLAFLLLFAPHARAQNLGLGLNEGGEGGQPVNIEAENGIEWRQNDNVYIARGNVKAVRGRVTLHCDTLYAYYRPSTGQKAGAAPGSGPATPKPAPKPTATDQGAKKAKPDPTSGDEGSTEIYRLVADGNVRFVTDTQTAFGDHADYQVDTTAMVMTGKHLKLVAPTDTITARDSLEWYDNVQTGVARGDAVDVREGGKKIAADVLTAQMVHPEGEQAHVSRIDADGHVFVSSADQIGRGDNGIYNVDTGIVTLMGNVRLTRAENEMRGQYGVMDLNKNVGHLLPAPPGAEVVGGPKPRVQGLLVPNKNSVNPVESFTEKPGGKASGQSKKPGETAPAKSGS